MRQNLLAFGGVLMVAAAASTPLAAMAKGPDFYAPLTIGIIGAGGERTFDANAGLDGDAAWNFVQQVDVYVVGQSTALPPPALPAYYEIDFRQDSNVVNRLPWYGTPAQFFYYPGRGSVPSYVRLHMARISEPAQDTWLLATSSLTDMLHRHIQGLQPVRPAQPRVAIGWMAVGFGLLVAFAVLASAVLLWPGRILEVAAGPHANPA